MKKNNMKAMKQLSKLLSPEEFFKLMFYMTKGHNVSDGCQCQYQSSRMYMDGAQFLIGAFCWDETDEGYDYWLNIYLRFEKIK